MSDDCRVNEYASNVCDHGTKGCVVDEHNSLLQRKVDDHIAELEGKIELLQGTADEAYQHGYIDGHRVGVREAYARVGRWGVAIYLGCYVFVAGGAWLTFRLLELS